MRTSIYDRISEQRLREEQRLEDERLAQEALDAPPPPPERFLTNELSFVRPGGFKDKTFHVFTLTDIGPSPLSVVVGRSAGRLLRAMPILKPSRSSYSKNSGSHFHICNGSNHSSRRK